MPSTFHSYVRPDSICVLAYYVTSDSMVGRLTASSSRIKFCGVCYSRKQTHALPHTCENRPTKLPAPPNERHTHKKMKADKCSRAKVTNWPTRESHLHFKRLHCLLADSSPSKTCFPMFPTKQHSANRSELADAPSLMSQHIYLQWMQQIGVVLPRNSTYTPTDIHSGSVD